MKKICVNQVITKNVFLLRVIIVSLLISVTINSGIAQEQILRTGKDPCLHLASPQTCDFVQYGNQTISHYTGQVDITIPIYNYEDNNFEIPIFLSYNSTGFMPAKKEGIVGLNWAINAGGVITRKVNGVPDDRMGQENAYLAGWYEGIKTRRIGDVYSSNICNIEVGSSGEYWTTGRSKSYKWNINGAETQPDEFIFNAPGIQGSFYIGANGQAKCTDNKPYKILLNLATQPNLGQILNMNSSIVIIADNGFQYYFGGDLNSLEISHQYDDPNKENHQYKQYDKYLHLPSASISGWHLTKIVAPNGRTVEYTYENCPSLTPNEASYPYINNKYVVHNITYTKTWSTGGNTTVPSTVYQDEEETLTEIVKPVYLKRIQIDSAFIHLNYVNTIVNGKMYNQLNNIQVKYGNFMEIENTSFTYERMGTSNARLFLKEIHPKGKSPYLFAYYNTTYFPAPLTKGVDHWGFWNGMDQNTWFIPYQGTNKNPNFDYSTAGMLKTVHYPTGGFSKFYYEAHDYSSLLGREDNTNTLAPTLSSKTGIVGGVRIKRIEDSDGYTVVNVKEYKYQKNNTTQSSGILMRDPQYGTNWNYSYNEYIWVTKFNPYTEKYEQVMEIITYFVNGFTLSSNSFYANYNPGENYIHYSEVKEIHIPNNGYKIYEFSNYASCPDISYINSAVLRFDIPLSGPSFCNYCSIPGIILSSRHSERGLVKKMTTYKENGEKVEEKLFEYTGYADYPDDWMAGITNTGIIAASYKIFHYPVKLKKETTINYFESGSSSSTIIDYNYKRTEANPYDYLLEKSTVASDGVSLRSSYGYITGGSDRNPALNKLFSKNMINQPISIWEYKNGKITGSSFINYSIWEYNNGKIIGNSFISYEDYLQTVYPSELFTLDIDQPVNGYALRTTDPRFTLKVHFEQYDDAGNILQMRKTDGIPLSFLWSYAKRYPVAEIKGATYDELLNILGEAEVEAIAKGHFSEEQLRQKLRPLREYLPDALVTTYTHIPLVGIHSKTEPDGVTTYYEYDETGRLKIIRDHLGNILQQNKYQYGYKQRL